MRPPLQLISAEQARARLAAVRLSVPVETVPIEQALGRVLAEPVRATEAIPAAPRAVMDGFAVRADDTEVAGARADGPGSGRSPVVLRVIGEVRVGQIPDVTLTAGQAARIPTGGCLPPGADAVVAVERVRRTSVGTPEETIELTESLLAGHNVLPVGADVMPGALLVPLGRRLRPAEVGALAATGHARVAVFERLRVAVLSSGNEVRSPGQPVNAAQVRDSNQYMLGAQAAALGCIVTHGGIVPDDRETLERTLRAMLGDNDVVILSAGTSVGERDFAADVIGKLGPPGILFHGIDIRPGKPTLAAFLAGAAGDPGASTAAAAARTGKLVFGMPGFPTSGAVAFEIFAAPVLRRAAGERDEDITPFIVRAGFDGSYRSAPGREDYVRVSFVEHGPRPVVRATAGGPASLSNILATDGLVVVPPDVTELPSGCDVDVRLFGRSGAIR